MSIRLEKDKGIDIEPVFKQNKTEKIIGVIGQIFILPSVIIFTIYSFVMNMVFRAIAELMLYVTELFVKNALTDIINEESFAEFPPIGKRYFLGLVGVFAGICLGATLWTFIMTCRLIQESIFGVYQAIRGQKLDSHSRSGLKNLLAFPGYFIGLVVRNTLRMPYLMICEAKRYVYLDEHHPPKSLTDTEFFTGSLGFIFGFPLAIFAFVSTFIYRMVDESFKTLKGSILAASKLNLYHDQHRTDVAQYIFGAMGLIVPYAALLSLSILVMTIYLPIASLLKGIQIYHQQRFKDLEQTEFLIKLKGLFQQLNNLNREFPPEN